jgi:transcriptional regulator with XRE-family HTH domain
MPNALDSQPGLGLAVRRIRERRQMSQGTLGRRAELHPTWISRIEYGKANPTWGSARRLAYALGVTVADLARLAERLKDLRDREQNSSARCHVDRGGACEWRRRSRGRRAVSKNRQWWRPA